MRYLLIIILLASCGKSAESPADPQPADAVELPADATPAVDAAEGVSAADAATAEVQ